MYRRTFVSIIAVIATVHMGMAVSTTSGRAPAESEQYLLKDKPEEAAEVIAVRKDTADEQEVIVVGRIGGRTNPWIKGAAAFSIVDRSLKPCNEIEGDTCKTPWDYCCEADLPKATVFVMVVDDEGKVVKQDARELLGVKELDTVYVQGKVKRDKSKNMTILAARLFIPSDEEENPQ